MNFWFICISPYHCTLYLLSDLHNCKQCCAIYSDEDGPRGKKILYINTYMWNLKKMVQMNLFSGAQNKGTDIENKHTNTKVGKRAE